MIYKTPTLPRITRVELVGYQPLFNETIHIEISHNSFLILGGNGLGKTTILQSIVYCIAGEADLEIEPTKGKRWGYRYFHGRIAKPENAYVEVEFGLNDNKVRLKRGFQSKGLLAFTLNNNATFVHPNAEKNFELFLKETIGYRSLNDFRLIVHKLCYLPEDRPNLVWDSETQIRLLMLLFNDIIDEAEFRNKRKTLKNLDSEIRHINVEINKIKQKLPKRKDKDEDRTDIIYIMKEDNSEENRIKSLEDKKYQIIEQLNIIANKKVPLQESARHIKNSLSVLTSETEDLQNQLSMMEEKIIIEQLNQFESREVELALHKLIHRRICPACGTKAEVLGQAAQELLQKHRCPLCGVEHIYSDNANSPLLDAQLSEKIREKLSLEQEFMETEKTLDLLINQEQDLQIQYDNIKAKQSIVRSDDTTEPEEQKNLNTKLKQEERRYQNKQRNFETLRAELEKKYDEFILISSERITRLGKLYENYASSFLGIPCQLDTKEANIQFLSLNLYVPKFDDQLRPNPDSCSEAQRFFLDIAFRMAMIDLSRELSQSNGSFICETPESALDITYIDNVASMFKMFSKEGHAVITTGNLQPGGLAGPILADESKKVRSQSILNLVKYGRLSAVQKANIDDLHKEFENILNYKK